VGEFAYLISTEVFSNITNKYGINMGKRTYDLSEGAIKWIDSFAEEHSVEKSEVVERALRVYAVKLDENEWDDDYWKDEIQKEFDSLTQAGSESVIDAIEIQLNPSWKEYPLIPVRKDKRDFFPGYKIHFTLETDVGSLETWVSGESSDREGNQAREGHPTAGTYIRAKIPNWAEEHPEIEGRDFVIVEKLEKQKFRLRKK
jgi:hypothetical protein